MNSQQLAIRVQDSHKEIVIRSQAKQYSVILTKSWLPKVEDFSNPNAWASSFMKGYSEIDVKSPYTIRDSYCPTPKELNSIEINLPLIFERNEDGSSVYERQKLGMYMLTRIIVDCLSSFNISRMMSENQILMLAVELIDEFPDDPLSVYKMFFTKAKRGYFGDDFNRIDAPTFFKWYRAFRNDIIGYIGNEFRSEPDIPDEDKLKLEENNPICKEEAEKRFEMLIKKLQINGK